MNSKAIQFKAFHQGTWQRCGYVVKEIVEDVHIVINAGNVTNVDFCWVKFKL